MISGIERRSGDTEPPARVGHRGEKPRLQARAQNREAAGIEDLELLLALSGWQPRQVCHEQRFFRHEE